MAIIIPANTSKPRKLIPAGTHRAVLTQCIHMGVQPGGLYDPKDQIRLGFELPDERITWEDQNGDKREGPAMVGEFYNLTLGSATKPSKLRKLLENWRGRNFTDEEAKAFNIASLLGKVCMVGVVHVEKNGNTYANLSAVMACPKSVAANLKNEGKLLEYSPDAHDEATYREIPQWLREKIDGRIKKQAPVPKPTGPMDQPPGTPFDDAIPFGNDEHGVISESPAW